jgi:hypothetical protein
MFTSRLVSVSCDCETLSLTTCHVNMAAIRILHSDALRLKLTIYGEM